MVPWPPSISDAANAKIVFDTWVKKGVPYIIALGMGIAQADYESDFNPNAKGDYHDSQGKRMPWSSKPTGIPASFGMYQRQKPRLDIIKAKTGIDLYAAVMAGVNTVEQDVDTTFWELSTFPYLYGYTKMLLAQTTNDAGVLACTFFERASTSATARGARATQWEAFASENGWFA